MLTLLLIFGLLLFVSGVAVASGTPDRRYRTGYKYNQVPTKSDEALGLTVSSTGLGLMFVGLAGFGFAFWAFLSLLGCIALAVASFRIRQRLEEEKSRQAAAERERQEARAAREAYDAQVKEVVGLLESMNRIARGARLTSLSTKQERIVTELIETSQALGSKSPEVPALLFEHQRPQVLSILNTLTNRASAAKSSNQKAQEFMRALLKTLASGDRALLSSLLLRTERLRGTRQIASSATNAEPSQTPNNLIGDLKAILEHSDYVRAGFGAFQSTSLTQPGSRLDAKLRWGRIAYALPLSDRLATTGSESADAILLDGQAGLNRADMFWQVREGVSKLVCIPQTDGVQLRSVLTKEAPSRIVVDEPSVFQAIYAPYGEMRVSHSDFAISVEHQPPNDAEVLSWRYRHAKRDGGPDMRFSDNPIISEIMLQLVTVEAPSFPSQSSLFFVLSNDQAASNLSALLTRLASQGSA